MAKGQTPIADYLCGACGHHERVTGRARVADYVRANPATDHRATCPANHQAPQDESVRLPDRALKCALN
ncbi:hypothetical protein FGK60_09540 [Streptomyces sp. DASNCL29]|nr:hypothetical protein FGK60_09540 [Streptomyces sp. DASNCL29]